MEPGYVHYETQTQASRDPNADPSPTDVLEISDLISKPYLILDTECHVIDYHDRDSIPRGHISPEAWEPGAIGLGWVDDGSFVTDVVTAEPDIATMSRVAADIVDDVDPSWILSYNGRAFDLPVLRRHEHTGPLVDSLAYRNHADIGSWMMALDAHTPGSGYLSLDDAADFFASAISDGGSTIAAGRVAADIVHGRASDRDRELLESYLERDVKNVLRVRAAAASLARDVI